MPIILQNILFITIFLILAKCIKKYGLHKSILCTALAIGGVMFVYEYTFLAFSETYIDSNVLLYIPFKCLPYIAISYLYLFYYYQVNQLYEPQRKKYRGIIFLGIYTVMLLGNLFNNEDLYYISSEKVLIMLLCIFSIIYFLPITRIYAMPKIPKYLTIISIIVFAIYDINSIYGKTSSDTIFNIIFKLLTCIFLFCPIYLMIFGLYCLFTKNIKHPSQDIANLIHQSNLEKVSQAIMTLTEQNIQFGKDIDITNKIYPVTYNLYFIKNYLYSKFGEDKGYMLSEYSLRLFFNSLIGSIPLDKIEEIRRIAYTILFNMKDNPPSSMYSLSLIFLHHITKTWYNKGSKELLEIENMLSNWKQDAENLVNDILEIK